MRRFSRVIDLLAAEIEFLEESLQDSLGEVVELDLLAQTQDTIKELRGAIAILEDHD